LRQALLHDNSIAGRGRCRGVIGTSLALIGYLFLASVTAHAGDKDKPYSSVGVIDSVLAGDSSLQGKVVYVDFWASWCPPCRASFPWMNRMAARYKKKGLEVVTINLDRKHKAALEFLDEMNNKLPVVYDSTGALARMFQIDAMPTSFLYERNGVLHSRHQGFSPADTIGIEDTITEFLSKEPKK
jgi:cytochrome c biogenesis protein CcmG/thiol:disulfide interchange protein DsbE